MYQEVVKLLQKVFETPFIIDSTIHRTQQLSSSKLIDQIRMIMRSTTHRRIRPSTTTTTRSHTESISGYYYFPSNLMKFPMVATVTAAFSVLFHHPNVVSSLSTLVVPWVTRTEISQYSRRSVFPMQEMTSLLSSSHTGSTPMVLFSRRHASSSSSIRASSYIPPDYTIDDDDDDKDTKKSTASATNENEDDILPTIRRKPRIIRATSSSSTMKIPTYKDDFDSEDDGDSDDDVLERPKTTRNISTKAGTKSPQKTTTSKKDTAATSRTASWMDRNTQFVQTMGIKKIDSNNENKPSSVLSSTKRASVRTTSSDSTTAVTTSSSSSRLRTDSNNYGNSNSRRNDNNSFHRNSGDEDNRTFREDFRGTRVFVQGLPETCKWQDLKDHFRVAGKVVFASVSAALDPNTNRPKGHGIVQFETTAEARTAIRIMRDHPLNGSTLYVREDIQDENSNKQLRTKSQYDNEDDDDDNNDDSGTSDKPRGPTPPSKWKCADPDMAAQHLDPETVQTVFQILKARNQARRRRNYEACDAMRDELKNQYNVHIDDRLTMWWIGAAPPNVVDQNQGIGRWKSGDDNQIPSTRGPPPLTEWRQIITSPENDACIDPDLVMGLLKQRDIARREKDFSTADALLEQARTAPSETHLTLRIHDESKTWRVWSDEAPPSSSSSMTSRPFDDSKKRWNRDPQLSKESPPAEQCVALCLEHAPEKVDEVRQLLLKFPGREYNILKKLKQRYLNQ